jgi:hypothetical protein
MTPFLPVEILRLIIDNFHLPDFSSSRRTPELERDTRWTLCALSRTSRTFRQVALPLLFCFIRIWNKRDCLQFAGNFNDSDNSKLLNTLVVHGKATLTANETEVQSRIIRSFFHSVKVAVLNQCSALQYFSGSS